MCRHRLRCIVTCGVVLLFSVQIRAQDIVRDEAQLLSPQEEQRLAYALRAYADSTSNQIIVRTVQTLEGADIATYATELGQSLGVGQADKDNGVVIVVAVEEREVFIAVGYGLEGVIPDVLASRIVRDIITPNFRHGQFYTGLAAACDALMLAAAGEYQADPVSVRRYAAADDDTFGLIFFLIVIGLAIAITALRNLVIDPGLLQRLALLARQAFDRGH